MTPRIDVEDATNKADLLEQEVRIFKLQAKLNRLNERQTHVSDGGCAGLQDLIDEYGEEFNKLSKTIKDQKTEIAHQEQTIESLYKATNASQAVVKEQKNIVSVLKSEVDQRDKAIDELRKLVNSTGADRDRWMDKSRHVNEIRAERDLFKHDSRVLMGIVGIVRESNAWSSSQSMNDISDVLVDYLDEPKPAIDDGHVVVRISVEEEQHE